MIRIIFPPRTRTENFLKKINQLIIEVNPYKNEMKNPEFMSKAGHSNLKRHAYKNYGLSRKLHNQLKYPSEYQMFLFGDDTISK